MSNKKIADKSRKHPLRYDIVTTLQKKQRDNVVFGKPMGRSLMIFNATNPLKVCVCVSC